MRVRSSALKIYKATLMKMAESVVHVDRRGLMEKLKEFEIDTVTVEHPEVFTVEEMLPHVGHLPGLHTKNLFLRDKKKKGLWLLSVRHDKDVNLNDLAKKLSVSGGLRFADEAILMEKLGVRQGCVTAFALINDVKGEVKFLVDSQLLNGDHERIYLHPLENSATTGISPSDFKKFLKAVGHDPILVDFD